MKELNKAIEQGNIDKVRELILVTSEWKKDSSPLCKAIYWNHTLIAELLLEAGADPKLAAHYGYDTPLGLAAFRGHLELIKLLMEKGADIHQEDCIGRTALHRASDKGDLEMVKFLIEKGANIHQADSYGRTPLHSATAYGYLELVKLLIEKGADINQAKSDGQTFLQLASIKGHLELVKLLIEKGADITQAESNRLNPAGLVSLEITSIVNIPIKSDDLSQFPFRMALDISGIYVIQYKSHLIKKMHKDLPWIPSRHGLYSKKISDQIKTILIMALLDHSSNQVRHPTGLLWKIPKPILFQIFCWLTLNNGTLIITPPEYQISE